MKIRKGFVSNSSSSSFIIDLNTDDGNFELNTPFAIAVYMIGCREGFKDNNKLIKKLEKALEDKIITKDTNLMFHSCNYDTYIMKDFNYSKVYIATCNNHEFDKINSLSSEENYELVDAKRDNSRFYYIEGGVFVTYIPYEDSNWENRRCNKGKTKDDTFGCYGEKFRADDGNEYCIKCELEKFKVPFKNRKFTKEEQKQIDILRLKLELFAKEFDMTVEEVIAEIGLRKEQQEKLLSKEKDINGN